MMSYKYEFTSSKHKHKCIIINNNCTHSFETASFHDNLGKPSRYQNVITLWILLQKEMMEVHAAVTTGMLKREKLQSNPHHSLLTLCFLQTRCPFWRPNNSVKALVTLSFTFIMKIDKYWKTSVFSY